MAQICCIRAQGTGLVLCSPTFTQCFGALLDLREDGRDVTRDVQMAGFVQPVEVLLGWRFHFAWRPRAGMGKAFAVHFSEHVLMQARIQPAGHILRVLGVDRQPLVQVLAGNSGFPGQVFQMWPRCFRVDIVGCQR